MSFEASHTSPDLVSPRRDPGWSAWRRLAIRLSPRLGAGPGKPCTCFEGEQTRDPAQPSRRPAAADDLFPLTDRTALSRTYLATVMQLTLQAEALASMETAVHPGPVALQAMIAGVMATVQPHAALAGLSVLHDADSHADAICCADPAQLHRVLVYLTLRALDAEYAPGHVRIMATLTSKEAQLRILGRGPLKPAAPGVGDCRQDLTAARRVLQAMGGALVLEPRRAGYLPVCVVLRALSPAGGRRVG